MASIQEEHATRLRWQEIGQDYFAPAVDTDTVVPPAGETEKAVASAGETEKAAASAVQSEKAAASAIQSEKAAAPAVHSEKAAAPGPKKAPRPPPGGALAGRRRERPPVKSATANPGRKKARITVSEPLLSTSISGAPESTSRPEVVVGLSTSTNPLLMPETTQVQEWKWRWGKACTWKGRVNCLRKFKLVETIKKELFYHM